MLTQSFLPKVGGQEFVVHYLADELGANGNRVLIFTPRTAKSPDPGVAGRYKITYFGVQGFFGQIPVVSQLIANLSLALKFLALHREHRFDLIHAHSASTSGTQARLLAKAARLPVVITSHGADIFVDPNTGYGERLSARQSKRVESNLMNADKLIAVSQRVKGVFEELVPAGKIFLVPNGVRIQDFSCNEDEVPMRLAGCRKSIVVLMVGRNVPVKGFPVAVKAFSSVVESFPNAQLIHVGRDGEGLSQIARELGIQSNFLSLGEVSKTDLPQIYCEADIFVLPSFSEAAPLVLLEAMAAGLAPIITTKVGASELVENGRNGYIVAPGSSTKLAKRISVLIQDSNKRRNFGLRSRARVSELDWINVANRYEGIFHSIA